MGDGGCDRMSGRLVLHLWDEPVGDGLLYLFDWVFPRQSLPWVGMSCIHCACSFSGRVVWGQWPPDVCGWPLVGFGRCVAVWCLYGVSWCFLSLWR